MSDYKPHVVIDEQKNIILPEQLKNHMVQYDHNVKTITFDCPRYSDGRDLSTMRIYVSYFRQSGAKDADYCENIIVDSKDANRIHFEWIPKRSATLEHGILAFLSCAEKEDAEGNQENAWHTKLCKGLKIAEGMDCLKAVIEKYPTIITYLLTRVEDIELKVSKESITDNINEALQMAEASGRFGKVKTVNGFEPDENGNVTIEAGGASSWNDLQDKPFTSSAETTTVLFEESEVTFNSGSFQMSNDIFTNIVREDGKYIVWYDGVEYKCTPQKVEVDGVPISFLGNAYKFCEEIIGSVPEGILDSGERFVFANFAHTVIITDYADAENQVKKSVHSFGLAKIEGGGQILDAECLPKDTIVTWIDEYMEEVLGGDY